MAFARFNRARRLGAYGKMVSDQLTVAEVFAKDVNATKAEIKSNETTDWHQGGDILCTSPRHTGLKRWLPLAEKLRDRAIENIGNIDSTAVERNG
ncbi:MAG: hypothetical protein UR39_C0002G0040 [Candidatus Woesebacteria bacterium GW2011_GWA1_33_30]|uniref:Uncharacterized protein n=1 Tax=Candidatus Woesebacteria bacterium GW2011_GWA2_33_28 TaxID=1618561 RepID=A0A0G0CWY7_9BACT|nr:MAG: hypothetical protein UR38_C0002G0040 [Candidatus Woesebacteria bacterium GW2011_GWA2_33_28]KKP48750.1 MAG: hypothetical protein UR39_C0002G0040 [Candidatus Woesebacteria bacterium GW2011_GWA1_33_30]KKP50023.1 MAG: hypothetical protein UR40_C0002G0040 [Microgenomates group bacterium GW2011_GWC1_33_32]KKP51794.1 MAG: hypothetical protein UR44_C0006G0040 [Candidatus Woesebacteria bacterium GW2011_GWB1_33_38]KKP58592.1 MAG: hypothetical protein UR48_C0003G0019 [Microgenomates group bacteriu